MLPEDGVALIGGQYLLGKTFVGADLSAAVMTGGVFAGEPVMRTGAILWFAAEGEKEIEGRVRASVENKFGGSGPQPFARQAGGVPLLTDPDALEKLKVHAQEAAKYASEKFGLPLALIVIDTVSAAAGFTDENSASETQKVMTTLHELSRATGALVLAIDHYGKQTETGIRHPSTGRPTRSCPTPPGPPAGPYPGCRWWGRSRTWRPGPGWTAAGRSRTVQTPAPGITRRVWAGCRAGSSVVLYTVDGGGHTWPGSPVVLSAAVFGPTTEAISATHLMLGFFGTHPPRGR